MREPQTPNDSDTDDDTPVALSWTCSRQSSVSDNYSLARTISNMSSVSTVSTLPVSPRQSLASLGEENSVFYDEMIGENPLPKDDVS